ncbi:hypothetical protein LIA77_07503 [Sarocladium implicatum]|nr:hypothetical protein LIA77_07503 [Sarocladium implicatum]
MSVAWWSDALQGRGCSLLFLTYPRASDIPGFLRHPVSTAPFNSGPTDQVCLDSRPVSRIDGKARLCIAAIRIDDSHEYLSKSNLRAIGLRCSGLRWPTCTP